MNRNIYFSYICPKVYPLKDYFYGRSSRIMTLLWPLPHFQYLVSSQSSLNQLYSIFHTPSNTTQIKPATMWQNISGMANTPTYRYIQAHRLIVRNTTQQSGNRCEAVPKRSVVMAEQTLTDLTDATGFASGCANQIHVRAMYHLEDNVLKTVFFNI